MQSVLKIVVVCGAGILIGLASRAFLPDWPGSYIMGKKSGFVVLVPLNRLAFWVCVLTGTLVGIVFMFKAMLQDLSRP
jgi:hypothetical protein